MQLKRLEAYGFKSFADKIAIDFDQGITAIVGPNGSGKSNITDAIRWVLGEQNIRNLRGTKAEDIIFAGSDGRRALGIAEVSLYFDNDGTLPLDFREVVITRRLYRSGESEFYINKARCRLKDIYNLFADTGIGHDGMSIIGQNRIDAILNSRPEERRAFFEETAGITKYRNRKRESVRKLTDTENNLVRVQDIIHEIEKQLEPLARHAEKTRLYNELNAEYKKCQLTKLAYDYTSESERKAVNDEHLQQERDNMLAADTKVKAMAAQKEQLGKTVVDLERVLQSQADKNEAVREKMEAAAQEMATLKERQEHSLRTKTKLFGQREQLNHELAQAVSDIALKTAEVKKQQEDLNLADSLLQQEKNKAADLAQKVLQQKSAVKKLAQQKEAAQAAVNDKSQALIVIERDLTNGSDSQASRKLAIANAKAKKDQLAKAEAVLAGRLNEALKTAADLKALQQQAKKQLQQAEVNWQQLVSKLQQAKQQYQNTQNQLKILKQLQADYEGFGKATKAVLQKKAAWRKKVAGAVAEIITVKAEYVTAIEVALGGNMQNIVTTDTSAAKEAISFLKQERRGRVTFLPLDTLKVKRPKSDDCLAESGAVGWANTLVTTKPEYQRVADFLLARILVADTLDNALRIAKKYDYSLRIVTLAGEYLSPGGSIAGGSSKHQETGFLNRRSEIAKLEAGSLNEGQLAAELRDACNSKQNEIEQQKAAADKLLNELQDANIHLAELKTSKVKIAENKQEQENILQSLLAENERLEASFAQIQQRKVLASRSVAKAKASLKNAEQELSEGNLALDDLLQDADDLAKFIQDRELKRAVLEQKAVRSQEYLKLKLQEKSRQEAVLMASEAEEKDLQRALKDGEKKLLALTKQSESLETAYADGKEAYDEIYTKRMQTLTETQAVDKKAQSLMHKLNQIRERVHKLELADSKLTGALNDLQEKILADFGLTPARAKEEAMDLAVADLRKKMQQLAQKIKALGPVNPNALLEYDELNKRYQFMQKQAEDLVEAKSNLEKILADMDTAMTKQFKDAFAKIQEYFAAIFVRLFGGGKAELKLLDEKDVLNTGVDILITLPQKKQQNLAALSGGERSLTVIALLFAFLKYRPSPFSVLDEIDAALDEANVVRFGSFLKEFAGKTQFIVVTHRKGTMEAVDTMYGVTIEAAGVSKILSVKINDVK